LIFYILLIPVFGVLYTEFGQGGFYAPYSRYEPDAMSDTAQLASTLRAALQRSFDARSGTQFIVDNWQLDLNSLKVDNLTSTDGSQLSFRVQFTANGLGNLEGARQLGWSVVATVPEHPTSARIGGSNGAIVYRFPEADFSRYASPFKEQNQKLFDLIFGQGYEGFDLTAPALALSWGEELQFRKYLAGIRGDPFAISGAFWRMIYLSVVVMTTLGLGDIIPITWQTRAMVGTEAIIGIVLAGLFLNALAYRASLRQSST
jgi:hypothetical protein